MEEIRVVKISKYLSKHLRHNPERIGLTLRPGGWVGVDDLIAACSRHMPITREELSEVVARNNKQRFSFSSDGTQIRANQGHSLPVDLQLEALSPPPVLYHGTARHNLETIMHEGLKKMSRHHVHLSVDEPTARNVGARHGRPVVLSVDAARMHSQGHRFYCSDNGVWLVEQVPPEFLSEPLAAH